MSQNMQKNPRIHPLFPTKAEVEANPNILYSDHLPILFETFVPVTPLEFTSWVPTSRDIADRTAADYAAFNFVSWNIMKSSGPSGFHTGSQWETNEDQAKARHQRIALALKQFTEKYSLHAILLQECTIQLLKEHLVQYLDSNKWGLLDNETGRTILYRKDALTPTRAHSDGNEDSCKVNSELLPLTTEDLGGRQRVHFTLNTVGIPIHLDLINVHSIFNHVPDRHERGYRAWLKTDSIFEPAEHEPGYTLWRNRPPLLRDDDDYYSKKCVRIVAGDTNTRIAPKDITTRNIATGAIPLSFNTMENIEPNIQRTDFPDAAFMFDGHTVTKLKAHVLNPETGDAFDFRDNIGLNGTTNPMWDEWRLLALVDDASREEHADLLALEAGFNNVSNPISLITSAKRKIVIRPTAKDNNQRGVGVWMKKTQPLYQNLKDSIFANTDIFECRTKDCQYTSQQYVQVCVAEENKEALLAPIRDIVNKIAAVDMLNAQINSLGKSWQNPFKWSGKDKVNALTALKEEILYRADEHDMSLEDIIAAWQAQIVKKHWFWKDETNRDIAAQKRNKLYSIPGVSFFTGARNQPTKTQEVIDEIRNLGIQNGG